MTTPSPLDAIPREHLIEMLLNQCWFDGYTFSYDSISGTYPSRQEALLAHWRRCYPQQPAKAGDGFDYTADDFPRHLEG